MHPPPEKESTQAAAAQGKKDEKECTLHHTHVVCPVAVHICKHTYIKINKFVHHVLSNAPKAVGIHENRENPRGE